MAQSSNGHTKNKGAVGGTSLRLLECACIFSTRHLHHLWWKDGHRGKKRQFGKSFPKTHIRPV